jgi:riboflavin kinase / FMN adenylyltransferase
VIACSSIQALAEHGISRVALACGNFDGVHRGHRKILSKAVAEAKQNGSTPTVLTFSPHPREFFTGEVLPTLSSQAYRFRCFKEIGIEAVVTLPFTSELANTPAEDFIKQHFLCESIKLTDLCVGRKWSFGAQRQGCIESLQSYSKHFTTHAIDEVLLNEYPVSSSRIRQALSQGDFPAAEDLMGHPWKISGNVIHGKKIASTQLNFPTANLDIDIKLLPISGVFAVRANLAGRQLEGLLNIGAAPTFAEKASLLQHVELHLFNFDQDIYDQHISVSFIKFLRPEQKFASIQELKDQITRDAAQARQIFHA